MRILRVMIAMLFGLVTFVLGILTVLFFVQDADRVMDLPYVNLILPYYVVFIIITVIFAIITYLIWPKRSKEEKEMLKKREKEAKEKLNTSLLDKEDEEQDDGKPKSMSDALKAQAKNQKSAPLKMNSDPAPAATPPSAAPAPTPAASAVGLPPKTPATPPPVAAAPVASAVGLPPKAPATAPSPVAPKPSMAGTPPPGQIPPRAPGAVPKPPVPGPRPGGPPPVRRPLTRPAAPPGAPVPGQAPPPIAPVQAVPPPPAAHQPQVTAPPPAQPVAPAPAPATTAKPPAQFQTNTISDPEKAMDRLVVIGQQKFTRDTLKQILTEFYPELVTLADHIPATCESTVESLGKHVVSIARARIKLLDKQLANDQFSIFQEKAFELEQQFLLRMYKPSAIDNLSDIQAQNFGALVDKRDWESLQRTVLGNRTDWQEISIANANQFI